MSRQLLNLPINIPWRQIAVSPDMMDEKFCNKLFPFAWRSSMAISVYEPKQEDLPEELCGDQITYVKVTTSITGYQPTEYETKYLDEILNNIPIRFPNIPSEDLKEASKRIKDDYFACYGVMLNVAVFPYPNTIKKLIERVRIDFSKLQKGDAPSNSPFLDPLAELDNPYIHSSGVTFDSGESSNKLVNLITLANGTDAELDLHSKMVITFPANQVVAAVESKIVYRDNAIVKMEAFNTNGSVGTKSSDSEPNQVHKLVIEGQSIEKVLITTIGGKSSLLEFAYFVKDKEEKIELKDYPHIIDFEPKRRDLYQASTQSDEVLSGSKSSVTTNKALIHTESTESSLKVGASSIPGVSDGGIGGSVESAITNKVTDQDQWSVQTDASRERRETQGTTAQLSQMYNLLTGYHAGTNRASFIMLPRPHVLQPTDFRTFVQGLRAIEGVQDYFLIVSRPKGIEGLCIEASLETGHFKEDTPIIEPPEEFHERSETFWVEKFAPGELAHIPFTSTCKSIDKVKTIDHDDGKWVVDQRESRKLKENEVNGSGWDEGHPGIAEIKNDSNYLADTTLDDYEYETLPDGISVEVRGRICGAKYSTKDADFKRRYKVFTRSVKPKLSYEKPKADVGYLLITSRGLCTCFKSGDCIEVVPLPKRDPIVIERIVDEPIISINKSLMTKSAMSQNRMPLAKEFLSKVQTALVRSHNSTSRRSFDDKVGFLESDYLKNQIISLLPKEYLKTPLSKTEKLPKEIVRVLGESLTVGEALSMDLAKFTRNTGLSLKDASKVRHLLLGLPDLSDDKNPTGADKK